MIDLEYTAKEVYETVLKSYHGEISKEEYEEYKKKVRHNIKREFTEEEAVYMSKLWWDGEIVSQSEFTIYCWLSPYMTILLKPEELAKHIANEQKIESGINPYN